MSSATQAEKLYKKSCKTCHGATGRGDGPRSRFLDPKPTNFTQQSEFKTKNDDEAFQVISEGGTSLRLSPAMPAWGDKLQREEIWQLIAFIRAFAARNQ